MKPTERTLALILCCLKDCESKYQINPSITNPHLMRLQKRYNREFSKATEWVREEFCKAQNESIQKLIQKAENKLQNPELTKKPSKKSGVQNVSP